MRKFLSLFGQLLLVSGCSLSSVACLKSFSKNDPRILRTTAVRDIQCYQTAIVKAEKNLSDCEKMLEKIKSNKNKHLDQEKYQIQINHVMVKKFKYQADIDLYNYHILLLKIKSKDNFNKQQILVIIELLKKRINNLEQTLILKEKCSFFYNKEKQFINSEIIQTKLILAEFLNLKEKK